MSIPIPRSTVSKLIPILKPKKHIPLQRPIPLPRTTSGFQGSEWLETDLNGNRFN